MIFCIPCGAVLPRADKNDCHQLAFAFPPGQEVLGSPDYTYRFVYYLCLLWIFSCAVFTVVYLAALPYSAYKAHPLAAACADFFGHPLCFLLYKHIF